jgi:hypothetical protein
MKMVNDQARLEDSAEAFDCIELVRRLGKDLTTGRVRADFSFMLYMVLIHVLTELEELKAMEAK